MKLLFLILKDNLAKSVDGISLDHEQNNRDVRKLLLQKGIAGRFTSRRRC